MLWGVNPSVSGIHLVPYIQEAQRRGARLVVVDPRRTRLAEHADLHLAVAPGHRPPARARDHPLALRERPRRPRRSSPRTRPAPRSCAAAPSPGRSSARRRGAACRRRTSSAFARLYAELEPRGDPLRLGPRAQPQRRLGGRGGPRAAGGGRQVRRARRRLHALQLGGLARARRQAAARPRSRRTRVDQHEPARRGAGRERARPSVELLFVYNCNPLGDDAGPGDRCARGLEREDLFTVVFDPVLTDTARYADVVLPGDDVPRAARDLARLRRLVLQDAAAVIPPGRARRGPTTRSSPSSAAGTGVARPGRSRRPREELAARDPRDEPARRGAPPRARRATDRVPAAGRLRPVQFVDAFPQTADRKVHLVPEALDREAPRGPLRLPARARRPAAIPLALISPATDRTISSTLGELHREPVPLAMHPDDAAARGIADGDRVRVFNALGEVRCRARLDAGLRAGVVLLPKGLWRHNTESGTTANALAPDTLTDLGGGACFNDARVEVAKADPA